MRSDVFDLEVKRVVADPNLGTALHDAVKTSIERVFYSKIPNPLHIPGCAGQFLYFHLIDCAQNSLEELGFERVYHLNQNRLVTTEKRYDYPISITFHGAKLVSETAIFKWPRGNVTMKSVEQNGAYYAPLQPSLFSQSSKTDVAKVLNLFVLCDLSPKYLKAWLVWGTEWTSKRKMLYCPVASPLFNESIDIAVKQLPDNLADVIITPNDSIYDFGDFGERATGTYD